MLSQYSKVRLISDRFMNEGAIRGMVGYIIEVYPDGNYEVEFSNTDGTTLAQVVVTEQDIVYLSD